MSNKSTRKPRSRKDLSRADLKAYEARRADEQRRIGTANAAQQAAAITAPIEHSYELSRDEEFTVIKSDLIRLAIILAVIAVLLVILTIMLR